MVIIQYKLVSILSEICPMWDKMLKDLYRIRLQEAPEEAADVAAAAIKHSGVLLSDHQ